VSLCTVTAGGLATCAFEFGAGGVSFAASAAAAAPACFLIAPDIVDAAFENGDEARQRVALRIQRAYRRGQKLRVGFELGHAWGHPGYCGSVTGGEDAPQAFAGSVSLPQSHISELNSRRRLRASREASSGGVCSVAIPPR
jgi:hypothetical protein